MKITNHTYTKDNIIEQINKYIEDNDTLFIPDTHLFRLENDLPSYNTIVRLFGSFKNLSSNFMAKNSKEGVILILKDYLKRNKLDTFPTQKQLNKCKELPSSSTILQYFPNRKELLRKLNIPLDNNTLEVSAGEKELLEFIKTLTNETVYENDRTALENGKEIDIYIPDLNIAIEYNGNYWHNSDNIDRYYHVEKTNRAKEFGIILIHIFESEWENTKETIKDYIRSMINPTTVQNRWIYLPRILRNTRETNSKYRSSAICSNF